MRERFLSFYGTVDNFLRSYGGPVSGNPNDDSQKLEESGEIKVSFSREIKFPRDLLLQFDLTYQEQVPELMLTEED